MEIGLLVLRERVAGEIPAAAYISVLPLVGEITATGGAAHSELADLAVWLFFHVVVDDLGFVSDYRLSGRAGRRVAEPVGNEYMQHLGRTDAIQNRLAGFGHPFIEYRGRQRLARRY